MICGKYQHLPTVKLGSLELLKAYLLVQRRVGDGRHGSAKAQVGYHPRTGGIAQDLSSCQHGDDFGLVSYGGVKGGKSMVAIEGAMNVLTVGVEIDGERTTCLSSTAQRKKKVGSPGGLLILREEEKVERFSSPLATWLR